MEETITISKAEYDKMQERIFWLDCLEQAGVDNWQGIGEAYIIQEESKQS